MEQLIVGDILQGVVADNGAEGEGVIKIDGYPVFVPFTIKGEQVRVRVTYVKRDFAFATLLEVVSPSPFRRKPICPYFEKCGGCDLMHICEPEQLSIKRDALKNALLRIGGIDIDVPLPIQGGEFGYRNKLSLPFAKNVRSGRISLGFFEKRSHKVVPIKWCALNGQWAADVIEAVTGWANDNSLSVYDETTHKGLLRHTVARMLDTLSITVVINGKSLPAADDLVERLREKFDNPTVYISENTKNSNVIMGDSVCLIAGEERSQRLGAFSAVVSPLSFLQVNDEIRDKIYDAVADALSDFDGDIVELYSGVGLLTAQLALRLPKTHIVSVEIEPSATENAARLMERLKICDRVQIITDDAVRYMNSYKTERAERIMQPNAPIAGEEVKNVGSGRVLLLDPPRRGCDRAVLDAATDFDRIIYISCNPATLARDVKLLSDNYALLYVQPFDMFPNTSSLETLAVLYKKPSD